MLRTKDLTFSYNSEVSFSFPDLDFGRGEQWLILGPSGGGKTTLLHLLAGLLKPSVGTIEISGKSLNDFSGITMDHFRGQHIGIVFQKAHLIRALNVRENIAIAAQMAGTKVQEQTIDALLNRLGLTHRAKAKVNQLSQGEQQRLSIARALVNQPAVIFADEPTAALDDENCHEVITLLEEQSKASGATLVIVTHDQRLKDRFSNQIDLQC